MPASRNRMRMSAAVGATHVAVLPGPDRADIDLKYMAEQYGEYLRIGETAFRIIDDSSLKIVLYVPARALGRVKAGTVLRVGSDPELASLKLPTLEAKVFAVAPAAEGKARTFRIEARARDKSGRWRPGMTGVVSLAR